MEKRLEIKLKDWDYTCGDGCCYLWGTTVTVNGEELFSDASTPYSALVTVLEHLGYEVEIEHE